jgi:tetratricopeptide (TPR) repeat protein
MRGGCHTQIGATTRIIVSTTKMKGCVILTSICVVLTAALWSPLRAQTLAPKLAQLVRLAPPFTANKLSILASLRKKDFTGLDSEFDQYQQAFEKAPAAELNEKLAFDSFATDDPSVGDLIEEWIIARPNSFAAHMAMGSYFSWRGWYTRGPAFADGTADAQFEKMHKFFAQSDTETRLALRIEPRLSIAYAVLLSEARGESDHAVHQSLESDALRELPASFVIREEVMKSRYPRWGGNHETMADFAQQSQAFVKENPLMHWLLGFIDADEGETQGISGQLDQSIVTLTRAIQKGGDYSGFYFIRGESYVHSSSFEQGLEDFDRANELSPQDPELLILRADVLARLGRPEEVLADLQFVSVFESPNENSTQVHDWAVMASRKQH